MELAEMLLKIEQANDEEINEIIKAVMRRYQICFPDWEVVFFSLMKSERRKQTEELIEFLRRNMDNEIV